ncbi:hypothetical protein IID27_03485 [Patescibacteria group bacterium]|nr:hypothetical protein [Patescibacteria group bacterium]
MLPYIVVAIGIVFHLSRPAPLVTIQDQLSEVYPSHMTTNYRQNRVVVLEFTQGDGISLVVVYNEMTGICIGRFFRKNDRWYWQYQSRKPIPATDEQIAQLQKEGDMVR